MTVLTYLGGGLLCIGWLVLLIFSLPSKSEQISLPLKAHPRNPSETSTPE